MTRVEAWRLFHGEEGFLDVWAFNVGGYSGAVGFGGCYASGCVGLAGSVGVSSSTGGGGLRGIYLT